MRLINADLIEFEKPGVMPDAKFEHAMANNVILCGRNSKKEMTSALLLAKCMIDEQPTVDAEPVVHANWKIYQTIPGWTERICGCCKCAFAVPEEAIDWIYCPNCGAKMDAEGL